MSIQLRSGYKQTEVGVIPEDWSITKLGNHAAFRTGPFGSALHKSDYVDDGVPVINPMQIVGGKIRPTSSMAIADAAARKLSEFRLVEGNIVIGRRGEMGRCALVGNKEDGWLCGTGSMIIRTNKTLDAAFLQRILSSPEIIAAIENTSVGSTMINLNQGTLNNLVISLPPTKAEQEAIAEALSDADALIESLEQLVAKKRLPGFNGECSLRKLSDMATLSKAGLNPAATPEVLFTHFSLPAFDYGAIPVVELGGYIGSNKFLVPAGAVLLSKLNPRIPRVWAPSYIPDNAVCSTEFLVLVPRESTNRVFLAALCQSPAVCYQMELHAIGTTGSHQRIHPGQALAIEVYVPTDNAEQTAIADILSDMDAEISDLEAQLAKTRTLKQGMMQKLLTGEIRLI